MKDLKPYLRSNYNGIGGKWAKGQKKIGNKAKKKEM